MKKFDPFSIYQDPNQIRDKSTLKSYSKQNLIEDFYKDPRFRPDSLKTVIDLKKLKRLLIIILVGFFILGTRTAYLQLVKGDIYRNLAEGNRIRVQTMKAARGVIYDRHQKLLVQNVPNFILYFIPADLPQEEELDKIIQKVSQIIEEPEEKIKSLINSTSKFSYQPLKIREFIEYSKALTLKIESANWSGVVIEASAMRNYLGGNSLSHILGYTGKITEEELIQYQNKGYLLTGHLGKTGLELSYEDLLRGQDGKKQIEVDSLGKEKKILAAQEAKPGNNLVLTIDSDFQDKLQNSLDKMVARTRSSGGAAVALDPRSGEIIALVSSPSYDNNLFVQGTSIEEYNQLINDPQKPLFFRAISGEYPSGSTIKPVIASVALQEGIITSRTVINSTGGIQIGKWFFPDWKASGHGPTDVIKGIAESVNTFFYTIGGGTENFEGLGIDRIKQYAELFGLNQPTGIDLPGEASGFLPTQEWKEEIKKEPWYIGDTYHLAIGQGDLLVTPLQVANFTATIANGGTYYKPHLLKKITDPQDKILEEIQPEVVRSRFIDSQYLNLVRQGLRQAVLTGSSQALATLSVGAGGKTGTAQFGSEGKTHAWFTAFAPFENPEIAITVIVEGGGEGHQAALPVVKEALEWYFSQK